MKEPDHLKYEWDRIRDYHPQACTCFDCNQRRKRMPAGGGGDQQTPASRSVGAYERWVRWRRDRQRAGIVESDEERARAWKAGES